MGGSTTFLGNILGKEKAYNKGKKCSKSWENDLKTLAKLRCKWGIFYMAGFKKINPLSAPQRERTR